MHPPETSGRAKSKSTLFIRDDTSPETLAVPAALSELIRYELKKDEIKASFGEVTNETEVN